MSGVLAEEKLPYEFFSLTNKQTNKTIFHWDIFLVKTDKGKLLRSIRFIYKIIWATCDVCSFEVDLNGLVTCTCICTLNGSLAACKLEQVGGSWRYIIVQSTDFTRLVCLVLENRSQMMEWMRFWIWSQVKAFQAPQRGVNHLEKFKLDRLQFLTLVS